MEADETAIWRSPYGTIALRVRNRRLARVALSPGDLPQATPNDSVAPFIAALKDYFRGEPIRLGMEDYELTGATPFRRRVWSELIKVGFGELITYAELAERAGCAGGARAVGGAVGANPLPIFIPCHRVVAAGGGLGGYGGGQDWKARLLRHEGHQVLEGKVR